MTRGHMSPQTCGKLAHCHLGSPEVAPDPKPGEEACLEVKPGTGAGAWRAGGDWGMPGGRGRGRIDLCGALFLELSPRETDNELLTIEDSDHWEYRPTKPLQLFYADE